MFEITPAMRPVICSRIPPPRIDFVDSSFTPGGDGGMGGINDGLTVGG
jgi:hypothetical protein